MVENLLNSQVADDYQIPAGNAFYTIDDFHRFAENLRLNKIGQGVRILSPAMANYAAQNHYCDMDNLIFKGECDKLHLPHSKPIMDCTAVLCPVQGTCRTYVVIWPIRTPSSAWAAVRRSIWSIPNAN